MLEELSVINVVHLRLWVMMIVVAEVVAVTVQVEMIGDMQIIKGEEVIITIEGVEEAIEMAHILVIKEEMMVVMVFKLLVHLTEAVVATIHHRPTLMEGTQIMLQMQFISLQVTVVDLRHILLHMLALAMVGIYNLMPVVEVGVDQEEDMMGDMAVVLEQK